MPAWLPVAVLGASRLSITLWLFSEGIKFGYDILSCAMYFLFMIWRLKHRLLNTAIENVLNVVLFVFCMHLRLGLFVFSVKVMACTSVFKLETGCALCLSIWLLLTATELCSSCQVGASPAPIPGNSIWAKFSQNLDSSVQDKHTRTFWCKSS